MGRLQVEGGDTSTFAEGARRVSGHNLRVGKGLKSPRSGVKIAPLVRDSVLVRTGLPGANDGAPAGTVQVVIPEGRGSIMHFTVSISDWRAFFRQFKRAIPQKGHAMVNVSAKERVEISSGSLFSAFNADVSRPGDYTLTEYAMYRVDEAAEQQGLDCEHLCFAVSNGILQLNGTPLMGALWFYSAFGRARKIVRESQLPKPQQSKESVAAIACLQRELQQIAADISEAQGILASYMFTVDEMLTLTFGKLGIKDIRGAMLLFDAFGHAAGSDNPDSAA